MTAARTADVANIEADEAELVARVASGDLDALGALFDAHADAVRSLAAKLGVSSADLDDVTHSVFLDLVRVADRHDGRPVRPWIFGMTTIAVRRHRRSLQQWIANISGRVFEGRREIVSTPEEDLSRAREQRRCRLAIDALSHKKREVFVLVVVEELKGEEVARILGIPVATVWTRLHHARRELREALAESES